MAATPAANQPAIWASVRMAAGGVIITPAAPSAMALSDRSVIAAMPGAETPTTTGSPAAAPITSRTTVRLSSGRSFWASPMMPRMVMPSTLRARNHSVIRPKDATSSAPSSVKGVGAMAKTPFVS